MLNRVVMVGRLTNDPDLRYTTTNNVPFVSFSIAVNRPFTSATGSGENESGTNRNNSQTDFFNCIAWRKQAENISKYLSKGRLVAVDGRLQNRTYNDNAGVKRYVTEIICDSVEFLESKSQTDPAGAGRSADKEINNNVEKDNDIHVIEDDLPF